MRLARPWLVIVVSVGVAAALVFVPALSGRLVSDTWYHLDVARTRMPLDVLWRYVPRGNEWYRPSTELVYWLSYRLVGTDALPMHLVGLGAHIASTVLIGRLAWRLTLDRVAAVAAAVAFLFTIHAGEVIFDTADIHLSFATLFLLAAVLIHVEGRRLVSAALALISLTFAEVGILALPLIGLYEVVVLRGATHGMRIRATARRLAPLVGLSLAYVVVRVLVGGFYAEGVDRCLSPYCLWAGAAEYMDRLVIRGDPVLAGLWEAKIPFTIAVVSALGMIALLVQPWRWPDTRPLVFGMCWAMGASLFFMLALFPYVSDRFLYVPDVGVALAIGATVAALRTAGPPRAPIPPPVAYLLATVFTGWVALSAAGLAGRASGYQAAGERAAAILDGVVAQVRQVPPGTTVLVNGVPRMDDPLFPPGNTGPYVFLNGLGPAVRIVLGDAAPLVVTELRDVPTGSPLLTLTVIGSTVSGSPGLPPP
ncbi:MAG: hypothetical protein ABIZ34_03100 [Candidatus Limnocylindrales bacterium]